jgi:hypothetical protein
MTLKIWLADHLAGVFAIACCPVAPWTLLLGRLDVRWGEHYIGSSVTYSLVARQRPRKNDTMVVLRQRLSNYNRRTVYFVRSVRQQWRNNRETIFSLPSVARLYFEEQLPEADIVLEIFTFQWGRIGGRCGAAVVLGVRTTRVEGPIESWDGSDKNRKLVVNVRAEAEDTGEDVTDWEDSVRAAVN